MKWYKAVSFSIFCSFFSSLQAMYNMENFLFSKLSLSHREFKGMGFDDGYSSIGLFASATPDSIVLPFLQAKLHVFNDAYLASNLGLGFRFSDPMENLVFGMHAFYDFRNNGNLSSHQASAGIEILGNRVGFRINGYCPVLGKYQEDHVQFSGFQQNQLLVKQKVEYSLPSADAELSFFLPRPFEQLNLNLSVGGYYLFKQKGLFSFQPVGDAPGARVKIEASPSFFFKIGGEYTYDRLFKSRYNGYINFQIPIGRTYFRTRRSLKIQDVTRNEIIPFYTKSYKFSHFNKNHTPYEITFVSDSPKEDPILEEDGSFESPYRALPSDLVEDGPGKIVYVLYKEGSENLFNGGHLLHQGQILASSGVSFSVGGVEVPALTPGKLPTLTNNNAPAVTAEDITNACVYGFQIEGNNAPAIYGKNASLTISKNIIRGSLGHPAVLVEDLGLKTTLSENEIYGSIKENRKSSVMHFENAASTASLIITKNKIYALNGENGITFQDIFCDTKLTENIFRSEDPSGSALAVFSNELKRQNFFLKDNLFATGFETAINIIEDFTLSSSFKIVNNTFSSKTLGRAIDFSNASPASLEISENTFALYGTGVYLNVDQNASLYGKITNNTFHIGGAASAIENKADGEVSLHISDNLINHSATLGNFASISIETHSKKPSSDVMLQNNIITTNIASPAISILNDSSDATFVIDQNSCKTASTTKGILIKNSIDGVLQIVIKNNQDIDSFDLENASKVLNSFQFLPLGESLDQAKLQNNPNATWNLKGNFLSETPISD